MAELEAEDEEEDKNDDVDDERERQETPLEDEDEDEEEGEGTARRYTTWLSEARRRLAQEMGRLKLWESADCCASRSSAAWAWAGRCAVRNGAWVRAGRSKGDGGREGGWEEGCGRNVHTQARHVESECEVMLDRMAVLVLLEGPSPPSMAFRRLCARSYAQTCCCCVVCVLARKGRQATKAAKACRAGV